MNDIITQFNKSWQQPDLFQAWQEEVQWRNRLRTCPLSEVRVQAADNGTLDFLYRSLYCSGRRHDFFVILFDNMNDLAAVKWLTAKPELTPAFLAFVPYHILATEPGYRQLQFLITIYRPLYQNAFERIVNVLDSATCAELGKRTASNELRALLRQRQARLEQQETLLDYGLRLVGSNESSYPTLFGDKLQILARAASALQAGQFHQLARTFDSAQLGELIESARAVFEAGLVEDSLALLTDGYESYLDHSRTVLLDEEELLYQRLHRALRCIIPVYALFSTPATAFATGLSCYREYFGLISPDPVSLEFLKIYEIIQKGLAGTDPGLMVEVSLKTASLHHYRPGDIFLANCAAWDENILSRLTAQMHLTARERMRALPHEAFVILEFLRLAGKCYPEVKSSLNLLGDYMELWKWAPAPLFLNQAIMSDLAAQSDRNTRRTAEKMADQFAPAINSGSTLELHKHNPEAIELFAHTWLGVRK